MSDLPARYRELHGYLPLHPAPDGHRPWYDGMTPIPPASLSRDAGTCLAESRAAADQLERRRDSERQSLVDAVIAQARRERAHLAPEAHTRWRELERQSYANAAADGAVTYARSDGTPGTVSVARVVLTTAAYRNITGISDLAPSFWADNHESVLAHLVWVAHADSIESSVPTTTWRRYIRSAHGDTDLAARHLASDLRTVFIDDEAGEYTTRAGSVEGPMALAVLQKSLSDLVAGARHRTGLAWRDLAVQDVPAGRPAAEIAPLLARRSALAEGGAPFARFLGRGVSARDVRAAESRAVTELSELVTAIAAAPGRRDDEREIANAAARHAADARRAWLSSPQRLADRVELQWALAEAVDLCTRLDAGQLGVAKLRVTADPDQYPLFTTGLAA